MWSRSAAWAAWTLSFVSFASSTERARAAVLPESPLGSVAIAPPARLVGGAGGGSFVSHAPSGFYLGAETAWTVAPPANADPAHSGWGFGLRAGYQLASGLAPQLRFDDLGITPPGQDHVVLCATAGLRYVLPLFPMPYVEVGAGPAFVGSGASIAGAVAIGLALPVARHVEVDVSAHDWIVSPGGNLRQVLGFGVGVAVGFGGRGR
jgi:hypothetical protein